jgi:hypothetical protein
MKKTLLFALLARETMPLMKKTHPQQIPAVFGQSGNESFEGCGLPFGEDGLVIRQLLDAGPHLQGSRLEVLPTCVVGVPRTRKIFINWSISESPVKSAFFVTNSAKMQPRLHTSTAVE